MKQVLQLLGGVVIAAGMSVVTFAHDGKHDEPKQPAATVIQGELIDTACYVSSDGDAKGKDHAECASKCLASGVPAAVLPEGSKVATSIRFLLTNPTVLAPYAGKTVKVEGVEKPEMKAIDVKKLSVKDGDGWKEIQLQDEHHKMAGGDAPKADAPKAPAPAPKSDGHGAHKH